MMRAGCLPTRAQLQAAGATHAISIIRVSAQCHALAPCLLSRGQLLPTQAWGRMLAHGMSCSLSAEGRLEACEILSGWYAACGKACTIDLQALGGYKKTAELLRLQFRPRAAPDQAVLALQQPALTRGAASS